MSDDNQSVSNQTRFALWHEEWAQEGQPLYIVAEMANAHDGSLETGLGIVEAAAGTGADAIKFQCFTADELLVREHPKYEVFKKLELRWESWKTLIDAAKNRGLDVFCDVFGFESSCQAARLQPTGFKVHASDVVNTPLLRYLGGTRRPVFLSTGGVNWVEISTALETLRDAGSSSIVLINGIQLYPTSIEDSNLLRLTALGQRFRVPVGYADHVAGGSPEAIWLPYMSVAAGARVIEKHITLNRSQKGTDYYSSLEPDEFSGFVKWARKAVKALGEMSLTLSKPELDYRRDTMKNLVAARPIHVGQTVSEKDVTYKRTDTEVNSFALGTVIGRTSMQDLQENQQVKVSDLKARIFASLACRAQSKRLYAKPLQFVGNRPILKHLIDRLGQVTKIDGLVLAISEGNENLIFTDLAREWGLPYIIGDQQDVLGRHIQAARFVGADIVVRVTTENPFVYQEAVNELIERHLSVGADLTVGEMYPDGTYTEVINVSALERAHQFGEDRHRSELCSLFIFENADVFKIERIPAKNGLARPDIRLTIDTPEDLIVARKIYDALEVKFGPTPPLQGIINYLDTHPDIRCLNANLSSSKLWL